MELDKHKNNSKHALTRKRKNAEWLNGTSSLHTVQNCLLLINFTNTAAILSRQYYYYLLSKNLKVEWFCSLFIRISFHLAKTFAVDEIMTHSVCLKSF